MTMIVSPWCTRRAAAPFTQISPEPRRPGMVYVSKRAPLSTSTTCTCSCSRMSAASSRPGSMGIEPTECRSPSGTVARWILDLSMTRCMTGSLPPRDDHVVDESGLADARGDGDQHVPVERLDRDEGVGGHDREVLGLDPELAHGLLARGSRRGETAAVGRCRGGGVEPALEGERAAALVRREADVAAGQREAVGLADGLDRLDAHAELEVAHQLADHGELL